MRARYAAILRASDRRARGSSQAVVRLLATAMGSLNWWGPNRDRTQQLSVRLTWRCQGGSGAQRAPGDPSHATSILSAVSRRAPRERDPASFGRNVAGSSSSSGSLACPWG
eukprot:358139-Chlamydomonas_euryale.AAC.2